LDKQVLDVAVKSISALIEGFSHNIDEETSGRLVEAIKALTA